LLAGLNVTVPPAERSKTCTGGALKERTAKVTATPAAGLIIAVAWPGSKLQCPVNVEFALIL
jgi:hypothetical protein